MRRHTVQVLVVLTALTFAGQQAAQGYGTVGSDRPPKATVSFDLYRDYLIIVRGSVGPLHGLNLLLDTGASPSVIDPRLAEKLHLNVAPTDVAVLSGNVRAGTATVPSLQLGPIRRDNLPVLIEDLSFLQKALPIQVDGMVGLDVLGSSVFVIDYPSREIRFGPAPSMSLSIPFQMKDGLPILDAAVNHVAVHLLLDTGSPSLILFEETAITVIGSKITGPQPPPKHIGDSRSKQLHLTSFKLGEAEFGREPALQVQSHKDAGHDFDGLMSPAALGITRVAVDLGRGTLAFARQP
jgi:Aspartyl protease